MDLNGTYFILFMGADSGMSPIKLLHSVMIVVRRCQRPRLLITNLGSQWYILTGMSIAVGLLSGVTGQAGIRHRIDPLFAFRSP